ncbi:Ribosomal protein S18 acetylase RimI [Brevibacterium aurantiacum]|uniref:Ribosomal protein S18 acetylase RimI n=1 Tax=Brevibacterium aurantiacum TaxID=273384 RepID=A0A2H1IAN9_BREAU|nr:GNAT family N-acetyltransferase [Brevibacterium aurantiacum]SMX72281.1 Ribosomal protein S18 acetylase RimI [Brevibacterium aurantiacum]
MTFVVRTPVIEDATAMAKVHVETWQETYQGTMPDDVLFAPDSLQRREHMWNSLLAGGTSGKLTIAVAEHDRQLVGIAMSGPSDDEDRQGESELFVLYTYESVHGQGAGAQLLEAVVAPDESVSLWVADPNPRAQAFYCKMGFAPDGSRSTDDDDGVTEIRMIRPSR